MPDSLRSHSLKQSRCQSNKLGFPQLQGILGRPAYRFLDPVGPVGGRFWSLEARCYHDAMSALHPGWSSVLGPGVFLLVLFAACGSRTEEPCGEIVLPAIEPPGIALATPELTRQNLVGWVRWLSSPELGGRHAGEPGADATAALLARQMALLGLAAPDDGYCREFELLDGFDYNVVGYSDSALAEGDSPVILLGAHYDGQGKHPAGTVYPGADDNASGLAVLLEVARLVARAPSSDAVLPVVSSVEVVFAALGAEEVGQVGAQAYLAEPPVDPARIQLVINLDMVGRPWPGDVSTAVGYQALGESSLDVAALVRRASELAGVTVRPLADLGEQAPTISDARVFGETLPTLLLSTALHEDHHELTDTPERIDYEQIERTGSLVLALIDILASHS